MQIYDERIVIRSNPFLLDVLNDIVAEYHTHEEYSIQDIQKLLYSFGFDSVCRNAYPVIKKISECAFMSYKMKTQLFHYEYTWMDNFRRTDIILRLSNFTESLPTCFFLE